MSVSLDALAMAGVDWAEHGKSIEEWEQEDLVMRPPVHLLVDADDKEQGGDRQRSVSNAEGLAADVYQKLTKLIGLPALKDGVLESIKAWWSSKYGFTGAEMEFQLKKTKIIHAL